MRKITNNVTNAFENNRPFRSGNDEVKVDGDKTEMYLHGNLIAVKKGGKLQISNCGWQTNVTKERLNGISGVSINQSKGVWYLNGVAWDGSMIEVK